MKKIAIILSIFLVSCGHSNEVTITKQEYNKLKGVSQPEYPKRIIFSDGVEEIANVIIIDSCEYVARSIGWDAGLLTHRGNCKFCQQRLESSIRRIIREELKNINAWK